MEHLGTVVRQEYQALLDILGLVEYLDTQEPVGYLGIRDPLVLQDYQVPQDILEPQGQVVILEPQVIQALQV